VSGTLFLLSLLRLHSHIYDYVLLAISAIILARFVKILVTRKTISVDLLMGVAGLVTWYIHAVFEGFLILLLYSVAELMEHWAEGYAERKITGLRELLPEKVLVERNGNTAEKRLGEVSVGDIVLLRGIAGVPLVLRFAHKYMYSIYASIASALVVKLASMIMGLLGYIPMWVVVGLGDDGATLIALGLIGYMLFIPK